MMKLEALWRANELPSCLKGGLPTVGIPFLKISILKAG